MSFTRDATRIAVDAATIRMGAQADPPVTLDVGYLEEESLKETVKPIETSNEHGEKIQVAIEYTVEFNLLQADYTMWTDLDALVDDNVDILIVPKESPSGNPYYKIADIPFRYEIEAVWAKSKARIVKVLATRKALNITNVVSKETSSPT